MSVKSSHNDEGSRVFRSKKCSVFTKGYEIRNRKKSIRQIASELKTKKYELEKRTILKPNSKYLGKNNRNK